MVCAHAPIKPLANSTYNQTVKNNSNACCFEKRVASKYNVKTLISIHIIHGNFLEVSETPAVWTSKMGLSPDRLWQAPQQWRKHVTSMKSDGFPQMRANVFRKQDKVSKQSLQIYKSNARFARHHVIHACSTQVHVRPTGLNHARRVVTAAHTSVHDSH